MATVAPIQPTPVHQNSTQSADIGPIAPTKPANSNTDSFFVPRGDVIAKLRFYSPPTDGSAPYNYVEKAPEGQPQHNYSEAHHDVLIHDLRGREATVTTDTHSFAALSSISSTVPLSLFQRDDPDADAAIKQQYYPEVEQLLLDNLTGSPHKIVIFDHTIRRARKNSPREPVMRVHVDQTAAAARTRVKMHIGDSAEAERLAAGRVRIVNVWRPLGPQPVSSFPLAMANGSSVQAPDLVGVEHRYPDRTGETAAVKYSEGQEWWYWSGMVSDERLFLKCFDSDEVVGGVGRAPHSAFDDPRTPEDAPARESIEVRCLVFG